jgi:DNA polymerase-3 subunit epsilon
VLRPGSGFQPPVRMWSNTPMRQIVLDTETTGLSVGQGHRIIEIGCVELVNRRLTGRDFHTYLNPGRDIEEGAERVHGISLSDLETAPRFAEVANELLEFIADAELVIHNAEFDVGFLEYELELMRHERSAIADHARVLDTLALARELHPGQRNSLDALCKRYEIDASTRTVHGALIDAELLARVYLAMTGGQTALSLDAGIESPGRSLPGKARGAETPDGLDLIVVTASAEEAAAHEAFLERLRASGNCLYDG